MSHSYYKSDFRLNMEEFPSTTAKTRTNDKGGANSDWKYVIFILATFMLFLVGVTVTCYVLTSSGTEKSKEKYEFPTQPTRSYVSADPTKVTPRSSTANDTITTPLPHYISSEIY